MHKRTYNNNIIIPTRDAGCIWSRSDLTVSKFWFSCAYSTWSSTSRPIDIFGLIAKEDGPMSAYNTLSASAWSVEFCTYLRILNAWGEQHKEYYYLVSIVYEWLLFRHHIINLWLPDFHLGIDCICFVHDQVTWKYQNRNKIFISVSYN